MSFFSIIIPVYNVSLYLSFCLDSVLNQIFTDYECILIDDGSTDESSKICDDYSIKDNRMKVIHKKNGGPSDARNTGFINSNGDYIVLLDSDDSFSSVESLFNLNLIIEKTNADVIFNSNLCSFYDNKNIIITSDQFNGNQEYYNPFMFCKNIIYNKKALLAGCFFSLKRNFLLKNNLFFKYGIFHEDELWMTFVICYANKIAINHNPFYTYRRNRKNSIMSEINPKRIIDRQSIIDDLLMNKNNIKTNLQFFITERCIDLWYNVFNDISYLEKKYSNEKKIIIQKISKQKKILLHGKRLKHYIYYFLLLFLGVQKSYSLKKITKKVFKKDD
jgi:glycosyltransferase involved in cell wall biosynthesis